MFKRKTVLSFLLLVVLAVLSPLAQGKVTSPKEFLGFNVGDDYILMNYAQLTSYWKKLDAESDRMTIVDIGKTTEGRTMIMAIISSPGNLKNLARYKDISRRLALAEGLNDAQARRLSLEGKAVVWIDGGLHATEVVGGQHITELVYQMTSREDEETQRILDNVILLVCPVNPDGLDLVANWYMREKDPAKRSTSGVPRLYQKYVGHDNNRDYYMVTQPETESVSRIFYHEWFPQIVYNHHQSGPSGTVLFCAPFRDPFNYDFDPLIPIGIDIVGSAMHSRFIAEGKPGATMRSGASYSTWWNGGLRSTVYFHNMIGILTEIIGNPTPMEIPFVLQRALPRGDYPFPIAPQKWHLRQSIDYSVTADRAILDLASRMRDQFLYNLYQMGRNSIQKGNQDTWTITPKVVAAVQDAYAKDNPRPQAEAPSGRGGFGSGIPLKYYDMLRDPAKRDPRGYIIPSNQADFLTAVKFVNTLIKSGIAVQRAAKDFQVAGKTYPAGSFVVKAAQAFRPHLRSMFEPQDHPNDFAYPGGPPIPPYDSTGWTVAFQMGVEFDRIMEGFDGPFEKTSGFAKVPAGTVSGSVSTTGYFLSHQVNDSFIAVNRLLKTGEDVYWVKRAFEANGRNYPAGTIYIAAKASTGTQLEKMAKELGLNFDGTSIAPKAEAFKLKPVRIGVWDTYGGSMNSGWTCWILERFEFPYETVFVPALDAGNLRAKYDVLIFPDGAVPLEDRQASAGGGRGGRQLRFEEIPDEYKGWFGAVTVAKTVPQILKFLDEGGTVLAIGSSTAAGYHARLPIADALVERAQDGTERRLPGEKFYIPGSVLRVRVDPLNPLAYGSPEALDIFFENSPSFRLLPDAFIENAKPVAWFDSDRPLRSGWAWGQHYLQGSTAVIDASVGKGKLFLYGPEVLFRGQPHGTFRLVFNGLFYGTASAVTLQ